MTPANRIEITLSDEKLAELDRARGLVPRAAYIKHALSVALLAAAGRSHDGEHDAAVESLPPQAAITKPQPKPSDSRVVSSLTDKDPVYERAPHAESKSPTDIAADPLSVICPTCDSGPGRPCRRIVGGMSTPTPNNPHARRVARARR